jgi:hypothetical protein
VRYVLELHCSLDSFVCSGSVTVSFTPSFTGFFLCAPAGEVRTRVC